MTPLFLLTKVGLYALMIASLLAATAAVTFRNIFHAALALIVTLTGVAGMYIALKAEFIAVVQILLYVGAIVTVILFAIMLTQRMMSREIAQSNQQSLPAFLLLLPFAGIILSRILKADWNVAEGNVQAGALELGQALLGNYVFPFEVISVILIAALIGAIVIARKE